jgi:hypothetical protein
MRHIYRARAPLLEFLCLGDDVLALEKESAMLDIVFLAAGAAFFILSAGYALICDRL